MSKFQVIVGNIGTVYDGDDYNEAMKNYNEYSEQSKQQYGRAAGEPVTLWIEGEPALEFGLEDTE